MVNSDDMLQLGKIQRELRKGKTPEQIGATRLGRGAFKVAYRLGNWVIKENSNHHGFDKYPVCLMRAGLHPPKSYTAREWLIQEYCAPINTFLKNGGDSVFLESHQYRLYRTIKATCARNFDCHDGNVGITSDGRLVCFDW